MRMSRANIKIYCTWIKLLLICTEAYSYEVFVLKEKPFPRSFHTAMREIGDKMWICFIELSIETGYWPRGMKAQARMRGYDV